MKLITCYIRAFGCLSERTYHFTDGLNQICEENGWGKSTFAAFIGAMFFGMPDGTVKQTLDKRPRDRYKPWGGGTMGGYLIFEADGKTYRLERSFGDKAKDDTFTLYDEQTGLCSKDYDEKIGEQLFRIDREGYLNSAFIGQNGIVTVMNDALTAQMSGLTEAEHDIGSFDTAMGEIKKQEDAFSATRKAGRLKQIKERLAEIEDALKQSRLDEESLEGTWKPKEKEIRAEIAVLEEKEKKLIARLEEMGSIKAAQKEMEHYRELCAAAEETEAKLKEMTEDGLLSEESLKSADKMLEEIAGLERDLLTVPYTEEKKRRREVLKAEFEGVTEETITEYCTLAEKVDRLQNENAGNYQVLNRYKQDDELYPIPRPAEYTPGPSYNVPKRPSVLLVILAVMMAVIGVALMIFTSVKWAGILLLVLAVIITAIYFYKKYKASQKYAVAMNTEMMRKNQYEAELANYESKMRERQERYESVEGEIQATTSILSEIEPKLEAFLNRFDEARIGNYETRMRKVSELYGEFAELEKLSAEDRTPSILAQKEQTEKSLYSLLALPEDAGISVAKEKLEEQRKTRTEFDSLKRVYNEQKGKRSDFEDSHDMDRLRALAAQEDETEAIHAQQDALKEQIQSENEELTKCKAAIQNLEIHIDEAMDLPDEKTSLLAEQEQILESKRILDLTRDYLTKARETFEGKYSSKLREKMDEYLALINSQSDTKYGTLTMDIHLNVRIDESGERKDLERYSAGIKDAVNLCKRFALIDVLYDNESPFIVMDDPFVNLDKERIEMSMQLLTQIAKKYQIIYFTCHDSRVLFEGDDVVGVIK